MKIADLFVDLHLDTKAFTAELDKTLAKASARGATVKVKVDVDTSTLNKTLATATRGGKATVNVDADTSKANAEIDKAARNRKSKIKVDVQGTKGVNFAFRGVNNLTTAITSLGSTAVPILAATTLEVGALGSAMLSAGGAGGTFVLSLYGQVKVMKQQQQGIVNAKKALDGLTPGTAAYAKKLDELNQRQRVFNATFGPASKGFNNLSSAYSGFEKATRSVTLGVMAKGLNLVASILPRLVPLSNAAGGAISGLIDDLAHFTKTREFSGILAFFQRTGPLAITAFGKIAGNVLLAVFNILRAFSPYQGSVLRGFEKMSASFRKWSEGFSKSKGFHDFIAYARQVLPRIVDLFKEVAKFVGKVIVALAPLGKFELTGLINLFRAVNRLPPATLQKIAIGIAAIVAGLKGWEFFSKGAAAGMDLIAGALAGNPLSLLAIALVAIAAGFLLAYKHSATFRKAISDLGGALKTTFGVIQGLVSSLLPTIKDIGKKIVAAVGPGFSQIVDMVTKQLLPAFDQFLPILQPIAKFLLEMFGSALVGIIKGAIQAIQGIIQILTGVFNLVSDLVHGRWKKIWGDIVLILKGALNLVIGALRVWWNVGIFSIFKKGVLKLLGSWRGLWSGIKSIGSKVMKGVIDLLAGAFRLIIRGFTGFGRSVKNLWLLLWRGVRSILTDAWATIKKASSAAFDFIRTLFKNIGSGILRIWRAMWSGLQRAASAAWGAIRTGFKNALNALKSIFRADIRILGGIWAGLKSAFAGPVNWIIDNVINRLIDAVNKVAKVLGKGNLLGHLGHVGGSTKVAGAARTPVSISGQNRAAGGVLEFDSGGVMPGYTPRRDVHHFYSPTAGGLHLSGGEAVMVPEWTKAVGGPKEVARQNALARKGIFHGSVDPRLDPRIPRFANGGIFNPIHGGYIAQGIHDSSTGFPAIDIGTPIGTPVYAGHSGRVTVSKDLRGYEPRIAKQNGYYSYGKYIVLSGGGDNTLYAHLKTRGVGVGASVRGGQRIGFSGLTGHTYGPHLHFGSHPRSPFAFRSGSGASTGVASGGGGILGTIAQAIPNFMGMLTGGLNKVKGLLSKVPGGKFGQTIASGVFGTLKDAAVSFVKREAKSFAGSIGNVLLGGGSKNGIHMAPAYARQTAFNMIPGSWSKSALDAVVMRESGWRWNADNPTSSAYGIPQALPGSKMASAGSDWHDNAITQIKWMIGYIKGRYGNPSNALAHEHTHGWYDNGGWLQKGRTLAVNNTGKPEAVYTYEQWQRMDRLIAAVEKGQQASAGRPSAPLIGNAVIRETVDLERYERQRAFRERRANVSG